MSAELVAANVDLAGKDMRTQALAALNEAADQASSPDEALEVEMKARAIKAVLEQAQAPFEETRLAGRASVVAARRLARMLSGLSSKPVVSGPGGGATPSPRGLVIRELGISDSHAESLGRLARADDAVLQRYIQNESIIPSITGALRACSVHVPSRIRPGGNDWRSKRRRVVGIKTPPDPSLDEAYALIVQALGHLNGVMPGPTRKARDRAAAIDHLYAAEDLLRPYRGGYVE